PNPLKLVLPRLPEVLVSSIAVAVLKANSTTRHTEGSNTATVNWNLSPVCAYTPFGTVEHFQSFDLSMRPVSVGWCLLGGFAAGALPAGLAVDDRPGRLDVS